VEWVVYAIPVFSAIVFSLDKVREAPTFVVSVDTIISVDRLVIVLFANKKNKMIINYTGFGPLA
jgi:hypothetical protein